MGELDNCRGIKKIRRDHGVAFAIKEADAELPVRRLVLGVALKFLGGFLHGLQIVIGVVLLVAAGGDGGGVVVPSVAEVPTLFRELGQDGGGEGDPIGSCLDFHFAPIIGGEGISILDAGHVDARLQVEITIPEEGDDSGVGKRDYAGTGYQDIFALEFSLTGLLGGEASEQ